MFSPNQNQISFSSTSLSTRWDVFISFRGTDTRYLFTDYLYDALHRTGIQTFMANNKLRSGESLTDALVEAIHESRTYVVVFSENYASSTWCLDELALIFRIYKSVGRLIVPVFYNIEPSVVQHQTGSFCQAFEKHKNRYYMETLDMWRVTLTKVGNISGYEVDQNMSHTDTINEVVNKLLLELMASTSYYHTPSPYPSTLPPTKWDVFVNCIDTRCTFTDYLFDALHHTGIRTCRAVPELRNGEVISDALLQLIRESKTYIVVFSDNYASSPWCLDELVQISHCYRSMYRLVIPVFYNINPSAVRLQTGSFKQAFEHHETCSDINTLNKWRVTLADVGNLSGHHVENNMSQVDIINLVVNRVLRERNPETLNVAKYPVGLDTRVKGITALLRNVTEAVIRFGIHGMSGVGKTTLAKVLYNQLWRGSFKGCSFLANVREVSGTDNGLLSLQQQLISDVLHKRINIDNVDKGIEFIRTRICSTKVLIVIDDLEDLRTLEFLVGPFALGSIIVITTRNEELLDSIKVEAKCKVNGLGDAESRHICWNLEAK